MRVEVKIPQPASLTYPAFIEQASSESRKEAERFWGVQVILLDEEGRVFVRRDPDGHKLEGHLGAGAVRFPNTRSQRFNGVSGGAASMEAPVAAAQREMEEELGSSFVGSGRSTFHEDVPVFACYQETPKQARLLGGLLVTYRVVQQEAENLESLGRFWSLDAVYRRVSPQSANDLFRPAFRIGIWILYHKQQGASLEGFVGAINDAVIETAHLRASERGIPLDMGVFSENAGSFSEVA